MNAVKLIGNVGQDLNMVNFDNGKKASFTLATNESYKDKNNQEVKNTTWHNVIAWGKTADVCQGLISKGKLVQIEGKITYRQYTNAQNQKVNITEIVAYRVEEFKPEKK